MHAKIKAIQDLLDALAAIDEEENYGGSEMENQPEAEKVEIEIESSGDDEIKKDFSKLFEPSKGLSKKSIRLG